MSVEVGYYKHFKGNIYQVLGVGKHSETGEELVVYLGLYDVPHVFGAMWIRPVSMFLETIERDGKVMRRFAPISYREAMRELYPSPLNADKV
jgi:hypothetical protein